MTIRPRNDRRRGKTNWAEVDALTDAQITAAVRKDRDAVPLPKSTKYVVTITIEATEKVPKKHIKKWVEGAVKVIESPNEGAGVVAKVRVRTVDFD